MLKIEIYEGDFFSHMEELTPVCDLEGSVDAHDGPAFDTLEEAMRILELCADRYSVPRLVGPCFTVFIGRLNDAEVTPLVRLDGYARNGNASAHVTGIPPGWTTELVDYGPDDDAVAIVRKLLSGRRAA